ncbi:xanthine dehydrogenase family protein molybdopterin-binding subunit [Agrobacterium cavarae]|uniref:xanthine dehydrogenase family protein molybdopterin-binding subunit n=1 Tax=Agrobacterium cavarae TaxID=2528239 RepID=UPI0028A8640C|nr:molybdopterin cofactor-binding domain-containing protein [Agrobacterium cavarae]
MIENLVSRRNFLRGTALATAGLVLAVQLPGNTRRASAAVGEQSKFIPNAFVKIDDDGITLIMPHTEVGQGIYTSSAMLMAEELEVDLDQVRVEAAPPDLKKYMDPILFDQATGGSTSTQSDWVRLREAGASARIMLIGAAAARWGVPAGDCRVEKGVIHHGPSGRSLSYLEVAADAATREVPKQVPLKDPSQFRLIGTKAKRLDTPAKVDGSLVYGIDTRLPGMAYATLAIAPVKGGRIASMNEAAARAVKGVREVVRTDDAVAVIGDHMWAAKLGVDALELTWESGPNASVSTQAILDDMHEASLKPGVVVRDDNGAAEAIRKAKTKLDAVYRSPFLSHSPLEPMNCTLHIEEDRAELWVGTQVPVRAQKAVAEATGLPPEKVTVNNQLMGGAFGRRLDIDTIEQAAKLLRNIRYPVKLVWTREQDLTHDFFRPYYYDRVSAGLDDAGRLVGRTHRVTGSSVMARWAPPAFVNGIDPDSLDCAAETPYDESAVFADYVRHEPEGLTTAWWRGVGATHNLFVMESFIDEMAHATGQDPVDFRRKMLTKNPRALAVLELAAEKAGWKEKLPKGRGRGVSLQFAFNTYLAHILDIEVVPGKQVKLLRSVLAVDCGIVINPDTVRAQMEGGVLFGLGTAMFNEVTFTGGVVDQSNFDNYRILRINEAPKVEVYQVKSVEKPGGVGEAGTAAAAGALANAIFSATGKRIRSLPLSQAAV